ncbi:hypothetical protein [Litchfieldia alkalitelluris]|nr:hypothetical protein [Litchfieldia alkalitelluris]
MPVWLEVIVRSFTVLIVLFLVAKLIGKKQLSELNSGRRASI